MATRKNRISARPLGALSAKMDQACLRTISCCNTIVTTRNNHIRTAIRIIELLVKIHSEGGQITQDQIFSLWGGGGAEKGQQR